MPPIPQETIEQVAAANDIVEVIGGYFPLKRAAGTFKAICPFHREKTPSFTVNPQRQIFKCFGCGAGGSVFRFVMDYEQIDFASAVRKLAERAGIRLIEQELTPEDSAKLSMRRRLLALHADATEFFHHQLLRKPSAQIARDYLKSRGITGAIAKDWKLGFAPESRDGLINWLREQKYPKEEVVQSGLVSEKEDGGGMYARFRNRVMFPICNDTGEVIAFSGRVLDAEAKAAKYVNSPETILFTKGAVLFGLHRSKRALIDAKSAIVCEGQLDLITAFEAGIQNVIAPQGTAFTDRQAGILRRYVDEVVLCFDSDAAGEKAAERSLAMLLAESLAVRVVAMPPGEDPDSLIRHQGADAFRQRVTEARDFFEFQLDQFAARPDFSSSRGRTQAARKLAGWVGLLGDPVMREAVMNRMTMRLEISSTEFTRLVASAPTKREFAEGPASEAEQKLKPTPLDPTLHLLVTVALHDADARAWLLEEEWRERLEAEPGTELLVHVLEADLRPEDPASIQAFLTTLEAADEARITTILDDKSPTHGLAIARDCWNELEKRQIRRRIDAIYAKLRTPDLQEDEATLLQKEVLDRQKRLLDIAPPLSPPL